LIASGIGNAVLGSLATGVAAHLVRITALAAEALLAGGAAILAALSLTGGARTTGWATFDLDAGAPTDPVPFTNDAPRNRDYLAPPVSVRRCGRFVTPGDDLSIRAAELDASPWIYGGRCLIPAALWSGVECYALGVAVRNIPARAASSVVINIVAQRQAVKRSELTRDSSTHADAPLRLLTHLVYGGLPTVLNEADMITA